MWKKRYFGWLNNLVYAVGFSLFAFWLCVASLQCSKDKSPVGPDDVIPIEACSERISSSSDNFYFTEVEGIGYITAVNYYINLDTTSKLLPTVGFAVYDDSYNIFGMYFGKFYDDLDYAYTPVGKERKDTIYPYETLWKWIGLPSADMDSVDYNLYALHFVSEGRDSIETRRKVEKYLAASGEFNKPLKKKTIKESIR
jgi:hypothetical protein